MEVYNIYKREYEKIDLANELVLEKNKPEWEFMDSKELTREMGSGDIKVDIKGLVGDITQLLTFTAGNITALPGFLTALDVNLRYYWSNETAINSSFHKTLDDKKEEVFVKFEYRKIAKEKSGVLGLFRMNGSSKKEKLSVVYFIAKPTNDSAKKVCTDLMNHTIQSMVDKLKK